MKMNFFTKDRTVFPPVKVKINERRALKGPADDRIAVVDRADFPKAHPDKHGDFLYSPNQFQFDGCEAFGALKSGMELYSKILGRRLPFAFPGKVRLLPHDDIGINAFYSRDDQAVHFLDMKSEKFKSYPEIHNQTLRMAESLDVSAHEEVGHLLLDGLKPEYMNFELETQAFHEAFGDISSMILALQFDQVLDKVLEETGGNLRQSNALTRLGREAGIAIQALSEHPDPNHYFLRDSFFTMKHNWKYRAPEGFSDWNPKDEKKLGSEPHNFSRFFSGLWYEILVNLYEQDPQKNQAPKVALQNARDMAAALTLRAVADFAPETTGRYSEIAKAMLQADRVDFHGEHQELLSKIFLNRDVLSKSELTQPTPPKFQLKTPIKTRQQAAALLAKHGRGLGILEDNMRPLENFPPGERRFMYQNKKGETFITYYATQEMRLEGRAYKELQGAQFLLSASAKLGFDKNGSLIHVISDLHLPEKMNRVKESIRQCHESAYIAFLQPGAYNGGPRHFFKELSEHHKTPYIGYCDLKDGRKVLERVPVLA